MLCVNSTTCYHLNRIVKSVVAIERKPVRILQTVEITLKNKHFAHNVQRDTVRILREMIRKSAIVAVFYSTYSVITGGILV